MLIYTQSVRALAHHTHEWGNLFNPQLELSSVGFRHPAPVIALQHCFFRRLPEIPVIVLCWYANPLSHAVSYLSRYRFSDRIGCQAGKHQRHARICNREWKDAARASQREWGNKKYGLVQNVQGTGGKGVSQSMGIELEFRDGLAGWQEIRARNKAIGLE